MYKAWRRMTIPYLFLVTVQLVVQAIQVDVQLGEGDGSGLTHDAGVGQAEHGLLLTCVLLKVLGVGAHYVLQQVRAVILKNTCHIGRRG